MASKPKIGEILVEAKVLTAQQVQSALAHQQQWGGRIGAAMMEKGFLSEDVLVKYLSQQRNVPSVVLSKVKPTHDVLARVPREMQDKLNVVPVAILKEGKRESLILAMVDPNDMHAIDSVRFKTGLVVKPVIAAEAAIKRYLTSGAFGSSFREREATKTEEEPEILRGSMQVTQSVIGENELVLESESSDDVTLPEPTLDEPPLARGVISSPAGGADPFAAAVLASARPVAQPGGPMISPSAPLAPPAPAVGGAGAFLDALFPGTSPIPGGPAPVAAPDNAPIPGVPMSGAPVVSRPGAIAGRSLPGVAPPSPVINVKVETGQFNPEELFADEKTDTELDIPVAADPPPAPVAEEPPIIVAAPASEMPPAPVWEPDPPTATRPSVEPPALFDPGVESVFDTQPGGPPTAASVPVMTSVARGVLATDDIADEISLPGPEPLAPPADLLVGSNGTGEGAAYVPEGDPNGFAVPLDMEVAAEPTVLDNDPQPNGPIGQIDAPAMNGAEFETSVPSAEFAVPIEQPAMTPSLEGALDQFGPRTDVAGAEMEASLDAPVPEPPIPESMPEAAAFEPAVESFVAEVPASSLAAGADPWADAVAAVEEPIEAMSTTPEPEAVPEPAAEVAPEAVPEPPAVEAESVPSASAATTMTEEPHGDEGTVLNAGAFEPTWNGEADSLSGDPSERPTRDAMRPVGEVAAEPIAEPVVEAPPPVMPATPPSMVPTMPSNPSRPSAKPAVIPESTPASSPSVTAPLARPARPPTAPSNPLAPAWTAPSGPTDGPEQTAINDTQAQLNTTFTKKLKLLNAIAELLLEKGVITEDEIKEKISKKRS